MLETEINEGTRKQEIRQTDILRQKETIYQNEETKLDRVRQMGKGGNEIIWAVIGTKTERKLEN